VHLEQLQTLGPILGLVCRGYMSATTLNNYPEHLEPIYLIPTTPVSVNSEFSTEKFLNAYMHLGQLQTLDPILGLVCSGYMSAATLNNYAENLDFSEK
jgi:hypothetical protein